MQSLGENGQRLKTQEAKNKNVKKYRSCCARKCIYAAKLCYGKIFLPISTYQISANF